MEDPEPIKALPIMNTGGRGSSPRVNSTSSTASNSAQGTPGAIKSGASTPQETPDEGSNDVAVLDQSPIKRAGLRRKRSLASSSKADWELDPVTYAMKPLTNEERINWKGWTELESDPAVFNYILRQYGVKDVKVQELWDLQDEMLTTLPKPVYGLIFLFQWKSEDEVECDDIPICPKHVWFANQTTTNACATVALLNIIMNVSEINLGEQLRIFKDETQKLKPPYRGQRLGQNEFIRGNHNSFLRRMEILNSDLQLQNDYDNWIKAKRAPKKKSPAKPKAKARIDDDENGFHFIAYVPINGEVWRLDGLQRQPVNVGSFQGDWMSVARDNITQRIAQYGDDGFNLLSLCRSPLCTIPEQLAQNIKSIKAVELLLDAGPLQWRAFITDPCANLELESNASFGLTQEIINAATITDSEQQRLASAGPDSQKLLDLYQALTQEQNSLQCAFMNEVAQIGFENEQAEHRKHDFSQVIYSSMRKLSEKGLLQRIVQDVRAGDVG